LVHNSYFVDPVLGKEFIQEFEMPITAKELPELYKYKESCKHGMEKSMDFFMQCSKNNNLNALIDRGMKDAIDYAFKNCGAKENGLVKNICGLILEPEACQAYDIARF